MKRTIRFAASAVAALVVASTGQGNPSDDAADKRLSGMSIVGNDEAPKSLVIVPWKSSELGDPLEVSRALDNERQPVDRDVFGRALDYYRIRSGWNDGTGGAGE